MVGPAGSAPGDTFWSMGSIIGEDLSALLRSVRHDGSFASRRTAPIGDLAIAVTASRRSSIGPSVIPGRSHGRE